MSGIVADFAIVRDQIHDELAIRYDVLRSIDNRVGQFGIQTHGREDHGHATASIWMRSLGFVFEHLAGRGVDPDFLRPRAVSDVE